MEMLCKAWRNDMRFKYDINKSEQIRKNSKPGIGFDDVSTRAYIPQNKINKYRHP